MVILSACESTREVMGLDKKAPDEFSEAPLEQDLTIPPSFTHLPQPGKTQETDPFVTPAAVKTESATAHKPPSASETVGEKSLVQSLTRPSPRGSSRPS